MRVNALSIMTGTALSLGIFGWGHVTTPPIRPAAVINQVVTNKKVVALTFDDGPTKNWTPEVLSVLRKNHIKATFFVIGSHATRRPEIFHQEIQAGMEIANHGSQHLILKGKSPAVVKQEVEENATLLSSLGAKKPTLYRLPGGKSDRAALQVLGQMGYRVIGWTIDTRDWRRKFTGTQIAQHVDKTIEPGSIIIFHDGPNSSKATVDAISQIIPALKAKGYQFETVGQMLKLEDKHSRL